MLRASRFLATIALLFVATLANATIFQIRGTVTESGISAPGLAVSVQHVGGSTKTAVTDAVGFYRVTFNEATTNGDPIVVVVRESGVQIGTGNATYTTGTPFVVVNVSVVTASPTITSFASADGVVIVNADSVVLVGQTSELNRAITVTRGGDSFSTTTDGSGAFELTASLFQDAANDFVATVADEFGKSVSASFSVTEDSMAPVIAGVTDHAITNQDLTPTFNEGTGLLDGTAFSSGSIVNTEGAHTLVVTDGAGNVSSVIFTIDKTPPVIAAPSNFQDVLSGTTLAFSGGDGFLDGAPVSSGVFVSSTGSHTLRAVDAAGNERTVSFTIRTPVAPTISDLSVNPSGGSLILTWTGSANFFTVFRDGLLLSNAFSPGYTDSSVTPGVRHSYRVVANRDLLEASQEASGLIPVSTPVSDIQVGTGDIQPGEMVAIAAHGAAGVTGKVMLVDQDGNVVLEQILSETSAGAYEGVLSTPSSLPNGEYNLVFDIGGQTTTVSSALSVDSTPPSVPQPVVTDTPAVAGEPFVIQVSAEPGSVVTADLSGLNPSVGVVTLGETSPGSGSFKTSVELTGDAGSKSVPITVADKAGNTTTSTLIITVETPDTPVSDVTIGDGGGTSVAVQPGGSLPVSVRGESGEDGKAELVDSVTGKVVSSGTLRETQPGLFKGDIAIPEGADATLDLRVSVGNRVTTRPSVVMIDGTPPFVGTTTNTSAVPEGIRLSISAETGSQVSVLAQGFGSVSLEETASGTFTRILPIDPAFSGQISFVVTATDMAGNTTRSQQTIDVAPQVFSVTLSLHPGVNLVYVPVEEEGLERLSDLLRRLGGDEDVIVVVGLGEDGRFRAFNALMTPGSRVDLPINRQAVIVLMRHAAQVTFTGTALPSRVLLHAGLNMIGLPRKGLATRRVSDLLVLPEITTVIREENGKFVASPPSDADLVGGDGLIVVATAPGTLTFPGGMWPNEVAAPSANLDSAIQMSEEELKSQLREYERKYGVSTASLSSPPPATTLFQNYPNPFNPETWIPFQLSEDTDVSLTVYDLRGGVVYVLDMGFLPAGSYTSQGKAAYWDGTNAFGEQVASGVYFYELRTNSLVQRARMVLRE